MCIVIPPKYAVDSQFGGKKRNFNRESLWTRGYAVSTVGFELEQVPRYIREQNRRDKIDDNGNF